MLNRHNDDDVKLMSWLMNGANHDTVDMCGKNVNSLNGYLIHARVGERVIWEIIQDCCTRNSVNRSPSSLGKR